MNAENMALEASYDVLDTILTYEERSELETCIGLLWPDNNSLSKYCRAVALKCLGYGTGHLFDPQEGVRYVDFTRCQQERPLMQAAADDAFLLLRKPSATARGLLPADFFTVRPFNGVPMAIGLRMAALEKAAKGVKLPRTPEPTPVPTRPRVSERIVISSALDVTQARVLLRELPRQVGIKCEGTPLSRSGRLCLVQVHAPPVAYVFDLLAGPRELRGVMALLKELLEDARVLKVLHDGRQDAAALFYQHGIRMAGVFDTQARTK